EEEMRDVRDCLASARLVTLTGTGGVGKTRLALGVAESLVPLFRDGVWFVDLAGLADAALVAPAVAAPVRIHDAAGSPALEALGDALRDRSLLLVLDNCEHLVEACAALVHRLLTSCAGLRILATSRQRLGVPGEVAWRVPSLRVPECPALPAGAKDAVSYFLDYEAVRLFAARARRA